jgi:hypothetical protein
MINPTYKAIARAAGYIAWESPPGKWNWQDQKGWSKEHGHIGAATANEAYKDCCVQAGLIADAESKALTHKSVARSAGYFAWQQPPGQWRWLDKYGWSGKKDNSPEIFGDENAAYRHCCALVGLTVDHATE